MRARLIRFGDMIQAQGIGIMREPYAKHLSGKLWELRLTGRDGIARSIYVTGAAGHCAADVRKEDTEDAATRTPNRDDTFEGDIGMRSFDAWKRKQLKDPEFRKEYDALEE